MRIRKTVQLKTVLTLYEQDIEQNSMPPSYQKLKTMVKKFLDQKMRASNIEARNERTATGPPAKSKSKGKSVALKGNREIASDGKRKGSVRGETLAVSATIRVNVG